MLAEDQTDLVQFQQVKAFFACVDIDNFRGIALMIGPLYEDGLSRTL